MRSAHLAFLSLLLGCGGVDVASTDNGQDAGSDITGNRIELERIVLNERKARTHEPAVGKQACSFAVTPQTERRLTCS